MGKLQINGDLLLAGNLMMSTSNVSAYSVISVKADSNGYGQNLLIGAGGNTVIGGGESASTFFTASGIKDEENLYLTADDSIHVYTNCDTIANRKLVMSMGADGNITTSGNLTMTETKNILLRPNNSNYTAGIGYDTNGNECIALWAKNTVTRLRWYAGTDMTNMAAGTMMGITPDFEISKASGTAIGYIGGNTILHSNNYTSYTVTKTGSGASGTWGINVTGTANYAYYLNTVAGNEIRIHNATGLTAGGNLWLGWAWADGNKTVTKDWYIGNFSGGGLANVYAANFIGAWQGNSPSAFAPASHSHSYVPISGGTMTGKLQVNNIIFGYNYTNSNNAAAFMWDKNGSNYTGVGSCNTTDMIHFGPCNASGAWVSNYNQIWRFQGGVYATGWLETDNFGTGDPGTSTPGYGRGGAIYFKVIG